MARALNYLKARLGVLKHDDRGVVTVEYAVLLVGIVGVVAVLVAALTGAIGDLVTSITTGLGI